MNKNYLIIFLLPAFLTVSCTSRNTVYLFLDEYLPELKTEYNIIEEFKKTAADERYKLKTGIIDSEENFLTHFNSLNTLSENDRVVMTSFVFNNYFSGKNLPAEDKIYLIGPYSGFNRDEVTIDGNWASVLENTGYDIRSGGDFNHIYFCCEKEHRNRFPEKEFIQKLAGSSKPGDGDNPLSVTLLDPFEISDYFQGGDIIKDIVIVFPGWDGAEFINMISSIKSRYILIDYADISKLELLSAAGNPLSVIKYDYKASFEAVLTRKIKLSDKKIIYISTLEKK